LEDGSDFHLRFIGVHLWLSYLQITDGD